MKKIFFASALTITLALSSQQQLFAWINSQFGVGMNWRWQSGGNSIGHGLYRDGQPYGPEFYHNHTTVPAYPQTPCPQPCPQPVFEKHSYHVLPQPHHPAPYVQPAPHYAPAPYASPAPYQNPAPYASPAPYQNPAPYASPAPYQNPAPYASPAPYQAPATSAPAAPYQAPAPYAAPAQAPADYPPAVAPSPAAAPPAGHAHPTSAVSQRYGAPWHSYRPAGR